MTYELTAIELTDSARTWLIERPIEIAVYIVIALVLRFVLHRVVDRATRERPGGEPGLLRPLRERLPAGTRDSVAAQRRAQRARTIGSVLKSGVSIVTLTWCVLQILTVFSVNVAPLVASAGVVGVALGFGAQNLVRDFLTGMFMLLEDQYGVGDIIDVGEASGTVETVGLRVTTIRDLNGTLWYCRNGEIARVGNMSQGHAVAVIDLPIAPGAAVPRATEVALTAAIEASEDEAIADAVLERPQMLGVNGVTAESVMLRLTARVKPGQQWAVQRYITQAVLAAFDEHDIAAPLAALAAMRGSNSN
ncbi:mechanosensitive ion channel [Rhodococcus hoagii]|jgi:small conductance mechanosensitive channel|uniref:Transporter, small conductance mechanosensitive ion channel MscS family protein n=3 Tax=Rhodococcus hoagii TaxID=43767 RepID=E9SWP8_RHOHA|nr:mechanosensitive ion channel domain-containing protein [Prescottella equi]MBU4614391.1 mechanosensitive ion channel [Rhodococcus sp. GG48]MCD7051876.1 mechanosensitive ion channel family protein [Rhodococcus sp. BH2-1]GBF15607.1 putative MscS family protein YkuT [Rhodococcus sp. Br-6]EGD25994.1 transporter, small conductance mechanosensitive ion channel MscS family protein [Prescottella equi ATCC 33707]ERN43962.1 mechanosensitive ion channel MscS [Prescottella equi NBRC 101255 = C 7]